MKNVRSLLSPEARIVLLPDRNGARSEEISALLSGPMDWKKLLALADLERSALPLWRSIRTSEIEAMASEVEALGQLRQLAGLWEFKLFHLENLLRKTLRAFDRAGFDAMLLKGAAAAFTVYDGFSERPMYDVDLLVGDGDAERAWFLAQELGWRWDPDSFPRESYAHAHHFPPLSDEFGSGSGLEIHTALWMPDHPFSISYKDLRTRALERAIEDGKVMIPRTNDQLLHCCVHFAWSHRMNNHGWRAFSDVDAFVDSDEVDWDEFVQVARATRADTCCYWTLRLSQSLARVPVPPSVLRALRPSGPAYLLDRLERHYALNLLPDGNRCPSLALKKRLWRLGIRRGKGSRGIHLPSALPPTGIGQRISRHLGEVAAWFRYIRRLA